MSNVTVKRSGNNLQGFIDFPGGMGTFGSFLAGRECAARDDRVVPFLKLSTAKAWGPFKNGEASHITYHTPYPYP